MTKGDKSYGFVKKRTCTGRKARFSSQKLIIILTNNESIYKEF